MTLLDDALNLLKQQTTAGSTVRTAVPPTIPSNTAQFGVNLAGPYVAVNKAFNKSWSMELWGNSNWGKNYNAGVEVTGKL